MSYVKVLVRFLLVTVVIIFFLVIGPLLMEKVRDRLSLPPEVPLQPPLTILEKSSHFSLLEEFRDVHLNRNVELEEGTAYMAVSFDETDPIHLASFDLSTGDTNWRVNGSGEVAIGESFVYFPSRRDYGSIVAYDKRTGTQVWEQRVDSLYVVDDLQVTALGLLVTTASHGSTRFHLLDIETGEKWQTFQTDEEWQAFLSKNGLTAYTVENHQVVIAQGQENWQTPVDFESIPFTSPIQIIRSKDQILAYGQSRTHAQLIALNRENGTILWQMSQDIKSNLAIDQGVLFFVTEDSELVAVDMQTGREEGSVAFSPVAEQGSGHYTEVTIATERGKVFVHFASSGQIFYFDFPSN